MLLCWFPLYSKVNRPRVHMHPLFRTPPRRRLQGRGGPRGCVVVLGTAQRCVHVGPHLPFLPPLPTFPRGGVRSSVLCVSVSISAS